MIAGGNGKTIILTSTGRTGTKFFASLFASYYPQVESHHASSFSTVINILSNASLMKVLPDYTVTVAWKVLKKGERLGCRKPIYIDANNHLYALPYFAPKLYSNLKVVHVIRDPRDYARSHINWAMNRRRSFVANFWLPFWQPNGYLSSEMPFERWLKLSQLERFCWIWRYKNQIIEKIANGPVPYFQVKFESFFRKLDVNIFKALIEFVGLDFKPETLVEFDFPKNRNHSTPFNSWRLWSDKQCAKVDRLCGTEMRCYQYGDEPLWREKVARGYHQLNLMPVRMEEKT